MTLLEKLKLFKEGMNDESCVLAGRFEQTIDEIIQTLERQETKLQECGKTLFVLSKRIERKDKLLAEANRLINKLKKRCEHDGHSHHSAFHWNEYREAAAWLAALAKESDEK